MFPPWICLRSVYAQSTVLSTFHLMWTFNSQHGSCGNTHCNTLLHITCFFCLCFVYCAVFVSTHVPMFHLCSVYFVKRTSLSLWANLALQRGGAIQNFSHTSILKNICFFQVRQGLLVPAPGAVLQ